MIPLSGIADRPQIAKTTPCTVAKSFYNKDFSIAGTSRLTCRAKQRHCAISEILKTANGSPPGR
jgi:hypothetical protein